MRKLLAAVLMALIAAPVASPLQAADMPEYYPPIEIPPVDYGLEGSFYLRGSLGANLLWSREQEFYCPSPGCGPTGDLRTNGTEENGYGYSFGAGFGYETGTGIRADFTVDHIYNDGISSDNPADENTVTLRSTIAMANVYYDFGFGGYGSANGGLGAYVGAGIGGAYNWVESGPFPTPEGGTYSPAGALMTGITYDMGALVADLGYRMIYMPQLSNGSAAYEDGAYPYYLNDNFIHEVRGTLRYRFN